jgi:plastocyanin
MLKVTRFMSAGLLALALLSFSACGNNSTTDSGGGGTPVTVTATDYQFDTPSISLTPGETVALTFNNHGSVQHTFSSDDLDGVDFPADPGATVTGTFTAPTSPGTYEFHCNIHPTQMKGTFVVGTSAGGGGSPAGSAPTTTATTSGNGY